jgi:hypothetical protein
VLKSIRKVGTVSDVPGPCQMTEDGTVPNANFQGKGGQAECASQSCAVKDKRHNILKKVLKKNINLKFTNPKDGRKIYDERIRQIFNVQAYTF